VPSKINRVLPLYYNGSERHEKMARTPRSGGQMARETEIKLHVKDPKAFRQVLKRLGARPALDGTGRVHEQNVIFDTPKQDLAGRRQLLRIRIETPERSKPIRRGRKSERVLLTFKRPPHARHDKRRPTKRLPQHKVLEELELEVSDPHALKAIFEGLGMRAGFRYEKFRTTYRLPAAQGWAKGLLIELDETPIGTFVELEGLVAAIDRAAKELGFAKRDYIVKNYVSLYREDCRRRGEEPGDMVFQSRKSVERVAPRKKLLQTPFFS
jgi:adenylate cyclase, class 2